MTWARALAMLQLTVVTVVVLVALVPGSVRAQATPASFETLIHEAVQEFDAGNFLEARILFERADHLRPGARTARALGFCDYELKHYVAAASELQAALDDKRNPLTESQRVEVTNTLEKARRFIGELTLKTRPSEAAIVLDGTATTARKWTLDAGDHTLSASATGYRSNEVRVTVAAGKETQTELVLSPLAAALAPEKAAQTAEQGTEPEPGQTSPFAVRSRGASDGPRDADSPSILTRWWFWTAVGVVVVGAGVGTAIALSSRPEKPDGGSTGVILGTSSLRAAGLGTNSASAH